MKKEIISTSEAPAAIGAYSQAVKAGELIFVSGQIPLTPAGELLTGSVEEQTEQVLKNLEAILLEAGSSLSQVVKVNIYAADLEDFAEINRIYSGFFQTDPPARAFVEVSRLPKDVRVEISCTSVS